jgi:hypothetical protein
MYFLLWLFMRLPVLLVLLCGLYWTYVLFGNLKEDTTPITNAAFAAIATLAALAFSCSRAVTDPHESHESADRFEYAGERFLHGAVLVLVASVLKYTYARGATDWRLDDVGVLKTAIGLLVGLLFLWALLSVHGGLIVLNRLLWSRLTRYPDWDDVI